MTGEKEEDSKSNYSTGARSPTTLIKQKSHLQTNDPIPCHFGRHSKIWLKVGNSMRISVHKFELRLANGNEIIDLELLNVIIDLKLELLDPLLTLNLINCGIAPSAEDMFVIWKNQLNLLRIEII